MREALCGSVRARGAVARGALGYEDRYASWPGFSYQASGPTFYGAGALRVVLGFGGVLDVGLGADYWTPYRHESLLTLGFEVGFLVYF